MIVQRYSENEDIEIEILNESRTVLLSDLGERFDCNYRNPEYFRKMNELSQACQKKNWALGKIGKIGGVKINVGSTPKGAENFTLLPEVPFIKTKNVYKGFLKTENLSFLTEEAYEKHKSDSVRPGNILLTIIGANFDVIGRAYVFNRADLEEIKTEKANINQNIARISEIPDGFDLNFFEQFLNSFLGQVQIRRFSKQAVQVNLSTAEINYLSIPKPPKPLQERLSSIILKGRHEAQRIRFECDKEMEQFNQEILSISGVHIPEIEERSFQTNITDQLNVNYYHPKYRVLLQDLERQEKSGEIEIKRLGTIAQRIERNCSLNEGEKYRYVELGDIDNRTGKISSYDEISSDDAPSRARWIIKENDILVPTLRGSSKNMALVDSVFDGCIASSGFAIFSVPEGLRYYVLALLRSPIVQLQYEQKATGSIMPDVQHEVLENFYLPIPKDEKFFALIVKKAKDSLVQITKFYDDAERIVRHSETLFDEVILGKLSIEEAETSFLEVLAKNPISLT
jgi:restriction endonuclease S subunit